MINKSQHLGGVLSEPSLVAIPPELRLSFCPDEHTEVKEPSLGPVFVRLMLSYWRGHAGNREGDLRIWA